MTSKIPSVQNEMLRQTKSMQDVMLGGAAPFFSEPGLNALRTVIRIGTEVSIYLKYWKVGESDPEEFQYNLDTIFSGADSFQEFADEYNNLKGAKKSAISLNNLAGTDLVMSISEAYEAFLSDELFESKCRALLDLFKLQLAFAAITYR